MKKINDRCVYLDSNGKRCRNKAVKGGAYHGDDELYPSRYDYSNDGVYAIAGWVYVRFCLGHFRKTAPTQLL